MSERKLESHTRYFPMSLWLFLGVNASWSFATDLQKCLCPDDLLVGGSKGNASVSKACGLRRVEMSPFLRGSAKNTLETTFRNTLPLTRPVRSPPGSPGPPGPGKALLPPHMHCMVLWSWAWPSKDWCWSRAESS